MAVKLKEILAQLRKRMHTRVRGGVKWLQQVVRGYFQYHAIPGNCARLKAFRREVLRSWLWALRRRSQRQRMNWERLKVRLEPLIPGKFVWFEHVSHNTKKAQEFYAEVLGWNVKPFPMGDTAYEMILTGDTWETMIGGYRCQNGNGKPPHWIATVSVEDVDAAAKVAAANGGKVVEAPSDLQGVGRVARIADPQGAELGLLTDARGDKPDAPPPLGGWLWNELHTNDTAKALSFYEKVIGFVHRSMDMGPAGMYHVLSQGGVDRGGVTAELPTGVRPHWLPYVNVGDVDMTISRAKKHGASILVPPNDIPDIGRFGVLADPLGGVLAVMKPLPREKQ